MKSFRPKPNFFWPIASVSGVLFLVGVFTFVIFQARTLVSSLKESVEVVFELSSGERQDNHKAILDTLTQNELVKEGSVSYTSKEEGLKKLAEDLGQDLLVTDMPNPLFDVITFRVNAGEFGAETIDGLISEYRQEFTEIVDATYEATIVQQLSANLQHLSWFFLFVGLILVFFAYTLIHNSIRLSIYAKRFLIRNMELVGASWSFIRRPFIRRSVRHGVISSTIAIGLLSGLMWIVASQIPEVWRYLEFDHLLAIVLIIFGGGLLINVSSTWFVVTKFLKMRLADLHQ